MLSNIIPIMKEAAQEVRADLSCREQDLELSHFPCHAGNGRVAVLSSIAYLAADARRKRTHFLTLLGAEPVTQFHLPQLTAALETHRLSINSFDDMGSGTWAIGASKEVVAPSDGVRCGLFLIDGTDSGASIRFFPNAGSRFRLGVNGVVYSTVHHNTEMRHRVVFDNGACRWPGTWQARGESSQLGGCELVADLGAPFPIDSQWLSRARPAATVPRQLGWPATFVYTDSIEPLPDGELLLSVWNTAQSTLMNYTFVVVAPDGAIRTRFERIEPRSRMAYSSRMNWFVNIGETESRVFDRKGTLLAARPNGAGSKPRNTRFLLSAIWPDVGIVMHSPWWAQTNSLMLLPEPLEENPDGYLASVQTALSEHDKAIRDRAKREKCVFFRFAEGQTADGAVHTVST